MALQSGNIASELAHYYRFSEQIPTAIHLSVFFDVHGEVSGAGGLFLQAMPGADEKIVTTLEQKIQTLPSLAQAIAEGGKTVPWLQEQFAPFHLNILEERPVHFRCRCNTERMRLLLLHLPLADLEEMRDNGPFPMQVTCHFCNELYRFEQTTLADICLEKRSCT
jgi:molecular chaperone Hsp33